ncbi:PRTRC system protein C [Flaviramulus basaltis]|uniref:PRTRC system protein C n=1 Tax=Flaviramulus basaltis TaxID=369401 RepID=A0A1K2IRQ3_9FLAO|nr:PRTRC system protein C [Flaviramulus basaltis]SFZ94872.1 PRTRC system protein C [Flaviramulus basaltis]
MQVTSITRKFVLLTGNKEKVELEDMNPDLGNEQIMEHYSMIYPELTNANVLDKGIIDGFHEIHFQSIAGTKG